MNRIWLSAAALGASLLAVGPAAVHRGVPLTMITARAEDSPAASRADAGAPFADGGGGPREPRERPSPLPPPEGPPFEGLDLARMTAVDGALTSPAHAGTARLTLDPELQRTATGLMASRHIPEAAVVLIEVATGRILVYASHLERGPARDLCVEATAPSASVFKIVTAAALLEDAHLEPDTRQCYLGGEQRIVASDLVDDPKRDRYCTTLASALGRSVNAVFARLAKERLTPDELEAMARRFGYGAPLAFDVPVQASELHVPRDPLEFARTAAGFWNTKLSPLEAAEISAAVAGGGAPMRPSIVDRIVGPQGAVVWSAGEPRRGARVVAASTAEKLAEMMQTTVREGTSLRAFHDGRGAPYLPGVSVAGKTGTLTDGEAQRFYTWFTGFAPVQRVPGVPEVAVAALVVNGPVWRIKANVLARDVLRAYFASHGVEGVSRPLSAAVARQGHGR